MDLHTAPKFQYAVERAVENERISAVVVDLGDVAFMDSTALSALMRSQDTLGQQGISLPRRPLESRRTYLLRHRLPGLLRYLPLPRSRHPGLIAGQHFSTPPGEARRLVSM